LLQLLDFLLRMMLLSSRVLVFPLTEDFLYKEEINDYISFVFFAVCADDYYCNIYLY